MTYITKSGWGGHGSICAQVNNAGGDIQNPYGVARIIPSHPNGQQIDFVGGSAGYDYDYVVAGVRIIVVAIQSAQAVDGRLTSLPAIGQLGITGTPRYDTETELFPNDVVLADQMSEGIFSNAPGGNLVLPISARPGGGLIIPPDYTGLIVVGPLRAEAAGANSAHQILCTVSVAGGPLAAGQSSDASNAKDGQGNLLIAPARFGNREVQPRVGG